MARCKRSPAFGAAGPHLSSPAPEEGPGLGDAAPFLQHCIQSFSICPAPSLPGLGPALLPGAHGCYRECANEATSAFVTFPCMSLGLGRRKLSFKLTNILPNSPQVRAAPAPLQSLSWIFPGLTLPFMSLFWLL